jgi:hypothetical protein
MRAKKLNGGPAIPGMMHPIIPIIMNMIPRTIKISITRGKRISIQGGKSNKQKCLLCGGGATGQTMSVCKSLKGGILY